MKHGCIIVITLTILSFLLVLPASAQTDIDAMVEELFSYAQEELAPQTGQEITYSGETYSVSKAYTFHWLEVDAFAEEYTKGDSLDQWVGEKPWIFVPCQNDTLSGLEYRKEGESWVQNSNYLLAMNDTKMSCVLNKELIVNTLKAHDLGNIQEIQILFCNIGGMMSILRVKSDTGEYLIPFGSRQKLSMVDGEAYTVEEMAKKAWWNWFGCTYYCRHCNKFGVNWLHLHWPYLLTWTIPPLCVAAHIIILLACRHKKKKAALQHAARETE